MEPPPPPPPPPPLGPAGPALDMRVEFIRLVSLIPHVTCEVQVPPPIAASNEALRSLSSLASRFRFTLLRRTPHVLLLRREEASCIDADTTEEAFVQRLSAARTATIRKLTSTSFTEKRACEANSKRGPKRVRVRPPKALRSSTAISEQTSSTPTPALDVPSGGKYTYTYVFAFGKHRGEDIDEVLNTDASYISWVITSKIYERHGKLRAALIARKMVQGTIPEAFAHIKA